MAEKVIDKDTIDIAHFVNCQIKFKDRQRLLNFACNEVYKDGDILEFGVWKGNSLKQMSTHFRNTSRKIYGFDSFEGLPEDWWMNEEEKTKGVCQHPKGHFDDWRDTF